MGNTTGGLPYDKGESNEFGNDHWHVNEGSKKDDKEEKVTIFRFEKSQSNKLPIAKQCWSKLRTMKHPFIVSFINGAELEDAIVLATEPVIPLAIWLKQQSESDSDNNLFDEIIWGFRCIIDALHFLHGTCGLIHGYLSHNAIYVTKNGDWKLGSLEMACNLTLSEDEQLFRTFEHMLGSPYRSPERRNGAYTGSSAFSSMDIFSLAHIFQYVFEVTGKDVPSSFDQILRKMLSVEPSRRPVCSQILKCPIFSTEYISVMSSLTELSIKTPQESMELMTSLVNSDSTVPVSACTHKLLPFVGRNLQIVANDFQNRDSREICRQLVQSSMNLLEFLIGKGKIDELNFTKNVIPPLINLWALSDRVIRTSLLRTLKSLVTFIPNDIINKKIFDPMLSGFADSNAK